MPAFANKKVLIAGVLSTLVISGGLFWYDHTQTTTSFFRDLPTKIADFELGSSPALANVDHFNTVKDKLIAEKTTFIETDLTAMKVRVYKEGEVALEVPILTKGREGSWWETPAGVYQIEWKSKNHYSSFGHVYPPWSMAFQGNFFIHGWPYYPDGTPVSSQYSGGCIRLSDEDAKAVYDLIETGTPVIVFEQDKVEEGFEYVKKDPDVSAETFLAADLASNSVLAEKNSRESRYVGSLAKFVTALVAAEHLNLDKSLSIAPSMIVDTSHPRLEPGTSIKAFQLLYPLLMESSNEVTEVFAQHVGRDRFVNLMNKKAAAIGMPGTRFIDPAGQEEGNVSTAEDLYMLLKYVEDNRSFVLNVSTGELKDSVYGTPIYEDLTNLNDFGISDATFVGGQTGQASNEGSAIAIYNLSIRDGERPIAFVLLNSKDVKSDMRKIVEHVLREY